MESSYSHFTVYLINLLQYLLYIIFIFLVDFSIIFRVSVSAFNGLVL